MSTPPAPTGATTATLAAAAAPDRNRAIDAYRAAAMVFVALGHWLVVAIAVGEDGSLVARNALEVAPRFAVLTWLFQVMPLFFAVGGFASAMSLDAHRRRSGTDGDWVVQRLRRLVAPTVVLAVTWLALLVGGAAVGAGGLVAAGAVGAAIPLWFLANYTIDTALAPTMLTALRRRRGRTVALLAGSFLTIEALHLSGVPWVEHVNWVLGWLLFQMIGFLWRDGALPTGRRLGAWAGACWCAAISLVAFGPWPATMIHVSGIAFSPTHPPSVALVAFGAAQVATAIAFAPRLTRLLARNRRAWTAVVAANAVSMSVYLWHFTAAVGASAVLYAVGALPTAAIGSAAWWVQKLPVIGLALVLLVPIVACVGRFERRALLAERVRWDGTATTATSLALVVSASLKVWSLGNVGAVVVGAVGIATASLALRRTPPRGL